MKVSQSCLTLCNPMEYTVSGILQARILKWVAFPFSRGFSQARDRTQVSHFAGGFFTSWTTREAQNQSCSVVSDSLRPHGLYNSWNSPGQNTGVGSLFLLQQIFPYRESNWGLLHCNWILYQLSYQGRTSWKKWFFFSFQFYWDITDI